MVKTLWLIHKNAMHCEDYDWGFWFVLIYKWRRNSPSITLTSNSWYESGKRGRSKPHEYRPESDFVSSVKLTYRTVDDTGKDPSSYWMLYRPLWAVSPSVSMRTSPSSHLSLQRNFFLPDKEKEHSTVILPPSVWMIVFALMSPQLHSAVENIHNDSDYCFLLNVNCWTESSIRLRTFSISLILFNSSSLLPTIKIYVCIRLSLI